MKVNILELVDGAKKAVGLTVIIDVFRAFSVECYLFSQGAEKIFPVGTCEEAFGLKRQHPEYLLVGERGGRKVDGFDFGNSPSAFSGMDLSGRTVIHTTSSGTQGIVNATHADEILAGSLVNAAACASYIRTKNPEKVSIVAMGNSGVRRAEEDVLCAHYIKALLENEDSENRESVLNIRKEADALRYSAGRKFFDERRRDVFPEADFALCTEVDRFSFALRLEYEKDGRRVIRPVYEQVKRIFEITNAAAPVIFPYSCL